MNSVQRVTHIRALGVVACALALIAFASVPARSQEGGANDSLGVGHNPSTIPATERAKAVPILVGYFRPHDAQGLNVFEPPKVEGTAYDGFAIQWGAAFTQQYQALSHDNNADPNIVAGVDQNALMHIGNGFNNADANLYWTATRAGIRVALEMYLSSRHHNETWVKDGYLLVDSSPWENAFLDNLMKNLTLKFGHFEINYGDMHFRRSDNGQAMFNPFVGNLLMDAFTTEIGGELYWRSNGYLAMASVTGGEVRGQVLKPEQRSSSFIGKLGMDKNLGPARVRLTGSFYKCPKSTNNTLYTGSRAGSRYFYVVENTLATESAQAWSGDVRPNFSAKVAAWVVNPFVKWGGSRCSATSSKPRAAQTPPTTPSCARGISMRATRSTGSSTTSSTSAGATAPRTVRWCSAPGPRASRRTSRSIAGRPVVAGSSPATCSPRPSTWSRSTATSRRATFAATPSSRAGCSRRSSRSEASAGG